MRPSRPDWADMAAAMVLGFAALVVALQLLLVAVAIAGCLP